MRTAAIHQPNYLPGSTYFAKIAAADVFVFLDVVPYTKNSWINRNRIKGVNGVQWITVPVVTAGRQGQHILETEIEGRSRWVAMHGGALRASYGKAPHFEDYGPEIMSELHTGWSHLAALNERMVKRCCQWLGVHVPVVRASDLSVEGSSSELLASICRAVGAQRYLSGPGGRKYMDMEVFRRYGIKVAFHEFHHPRYRQLHGAFEPNMSVCDLLFNEGSASLDILSGGIEIVE